MARFHVARNSYLLPQVDCIVATAGGIEEDFIKCLAPTYMGDFSLKGSDLRKKGINRIGNLLVPNDNYVKFEDWILPIFDKMLKEQKEVLIKNQPHKHVYKFHSLCPIQLTFTVSGGCFVDPL